MKVLFLVYLGLIGCGLHNKKESRPEAPDSRISQVEAPLFRQISTFAQSWQEETGDEAKELRAIHRIYPLSFHRSTFEDDGHTVAELNLKFERVIQDAQRHAQDGGYCKKWDEERNGLCYEGFVLAYGSELQAVLIQSPESVEFMAGYDQAVSEFFACLDDGARVGRDCLKSLASEAFLLKWPVAGDNVPNLE